MYRANLREIEATLQRCATIDRAHIKLSVADLILRKKYAEARKEIHIGRKRAVITTPEALELLSGIVNAELADKQIAVN